MKKFAIIYGKKDSELQKRAVEELTRTLIDYTVERPAEYPVVYPCCTPVNTDEYSCIYIGTKQSNCYIRENSKQTLTRAEEYYITVADNTVMIEGYDDAGVLYGVLDFYNKYIVKYDRVCYPGCLQRFYDLENMPDFEYGSAPSIKRRGLWTWGHVIYDYKGYLDHMMKLKMNEVVIWNDFAPTNADDIVKYAHARNIRVIWGFSWLWDTHHHKIDIANLDGRSEEILEKYESQYANIGGDGIYFQTFTEKTVDSIDGMLIAEAAANFVNKTAALFYEKYPELELQFGLHATSVRNRLEFIKTVDPRIRIVWEDCGAFPFYDFQSKGVLSFDGTKALMGEVANLRGKDDLFGVVTKSMVKLDWSCFEHLTGPQCIGISSEYAKKNRIERKSKIWRFIQAYWIEHADEAMEMINELRRLKDGELCALALVEDSMFDENIMYPVALYSEMLWDCDADVRKLMADVAYRSYVDFA